MLPVTYLKYGFRIHNMCHCFVSLDRNEARQVCIESGAFYLIQHIIVGVIYWPPCTYANQFNDTINHVSQRVRHKGKLCYLLGEYNINLLKHGSQKPASKFFDMLYGNSFHSLINRLPSNTLNSATLIDKIFTDEMNMKGGKVSGVLPAAITDHYPIFHIIKTHKK